MPLRERALSRSGLSVCLALWLAALLAIMPYARPALLGLDRIAMPAGPPSLVRDIGLDEAEPPGQRLRADEPSLGVLPRPPYVETSFALPLDKKAPPVRAAIPDPPALASSAPASSRADGPDAFQRSAVGTARTPTGPPV